MNNHLWIFVAVAGVVAAAVLWGGWLWLRKKVRLSEQFQRDARKEIDSLRHHVETLEGTALVAVRQQVESLDTRQSRDENQRLVEISGLRGQLDGLSTKESEAQMRETLCAVRQQVEGLEERQSREGSSWSEGISGLHRQLAETFSAIHRQMEGLEERHSRELHVQLEGLVTRMREAYVDLEERQSREESSRVEEISGLRARLGPVHTT